MGVGVAYIVVCSHVSQIYSSCMAVNLTQGLSRGVAYALRCMNTVQCSFKCGLVWAATAEGLFILHTTSCRLCSRSV